MARFLQTIKITTSANDEKLSDVGFDKRSIQTNLGWKFEYIFYINEIFVFHMQCTVRGLNGLLNL